MIQHGNKFIFTAHTEGVSCCMLLVQEELQITMPVAIKHLGGLLETDWVVVLYIAI